jgi:hypothetical protein
VPLNSVFELLLIYQLLLLQISHIFIEFHFHALFLSFSFFFLFWLEMSISVFRFNPTVHVIFSCSPGVFKLLVKPVDLLLFLLDLFSKLNRLFVLSKDILSQYLREALEVWQNDEDVDKRKERPSEDCHQ